jgi:hypothetical protein
MPREILSKVSDLAVKTLLKLAEEEVLNESVNQILVYLDELSFEDIYNLAKANKGLSSVPEEELASWDNRIKLLAKVALRLNKVQTVREIIAKVSPPEIITSVLSEANSRGEEEAVRKLGFIVNTPICLKWLNREIEELRAFVINRFDYWVSQSASSAASKEATTDSSQL